MDYKENRMYNTIFNIGTIISDNVYQREESKILFDTLIDEVRDKLSEYDKKYIVRQKSLIPSTRMNRRILMDIIDNSGKVKAIIADISDRNPIIYYTLGMLTTIAPLEEWDLNLYIFNRTSNKYNQSGYYHGIPSILHPQVSPEMIYNYNIRYGEVTWHDSEQFEGLIDDLCRDVMKDM